MLCTLKLEAIGDNIVYARKMHRRYGLEWKPRTRIEREAEQPWVARITGLDQTYGFRREFLRGQRDYFEANSCGSRGIWVWYHLDDGLYEVNELLGWKKRHRYFLRIVNSEATELRMKEVVECLS